MIPLVPRSTPRPGTALRAGRAALVLVALVAWPALAALAAGPASATTPAASAQVQVESFTLDNGLTFLLVRKPELTTVAAGWVAHVGSANERPGITGLTHLFEHMMFKGSR
ncbi:MAG: insulinase family protein, partial [Acidobacteria bacterium]|nr:insulinase family protein [Acidobacteriota bacterium]